MAGVTSTSAVHREELYRAGAQQYFHLAQMMHEVLMAISPETWSVDHGAHGAQAHSCQRADGEGYYFDYARSLEFSRPTAEELQARAVAAFEAAQLSVRATSFGGDDGGASGASDVSPGQPAQYNVIGAGRGIARATVRIRPATGQVRVQACTYCHPGSAAEINGMVFADDSFDVWRRLPATEGPGTQPQFHFPPSAPRYYTAGGAPMDPRPREQ